MRKITGIVLLVVLIMMMLPWCAGMITEHVSRHLIDYYKAQKNIAIQVERYQRGWFGSQVKLHVKIMKPELIQLVKQAGVEKPRLEFVIDQKIQHGPIFYNKPKGLPFFVGLAAIQSNIKVSPDVQAFLQITPSQNVFINDLSMISFFGNYFQQIQISPFQFVQDDLRIQAKYGAEGNFWIYLGGNHVSGNVVFPDILLKQQDGYTWNAATLKVNFNQYISTNHLWIGKLDLMFAESFFRNVTGDKILLKNVKSQGNIAESSDKIRGDRNLEIDSVQVNDEVFGPISLQVAMTGLDAKVIADMVAAYQKIQQQGELYASQLQLKLFSMAPAAFLADTRLILKTFDLAAHEGTLHMAGEMTWPSNEGTASDLSEVIGDGDAQAKLRVSKSLAYRLVGYAADMPFMRTITRARQRELIDLADEIDMANQRNYLFLVTVVDNKQLSEASALTLLDFQKNDAEITDYAKTLRELFLTGQITRPLSYLLFWKYLDVRQHVELFKMAMNADDKAFKKELYDQLNQWLKQGYIMQKNDDYIVKIYKENGVLKLNEKEVLSLNRKGALRNKKRI
jgi:uncharacterized protein YdgA (DUF945 family)